MNSKRWVAIFIAVGLFLVSSAFTMFTTVFSTTWDDLFQVSDHDFEEKIIERGNGNGKIAVVSLNGVIESGYDVPSIFSSVGYNHKEFLQQLDYAAKDGQVRGIIIHVNTPGGGVVESSEIHDKIVSIQEEYNKPVYISMGSMAASGGYYIAAPASGIYANPQTLTGSIGVIMQSINVSQLAEDLGIQAEVIKSGPYKDIMSATREMTEDEREIMQIMIDESYENFVDVIEAGRDLPRSEIYELADGRIFSGRQAYEAGLIDGLGHLHDVYDIVREELGQGNLEIVEYTTSIGLSSLFSYSIQEILSNQSELLGLRGWLQQNQGPKMMYLYTD
ncbi:signal peptide peptidase SppA [Evansella sp. AB-P1]|uniref:signal peptide peptidase SppA n=1 Tax=Evansella sp. AB-P1 TaxID=3037653 RepID=UPI00241D7ABA|nr:signal peptide peptidase SppA [Evansella sp. AB-P1]MDG5787007.1 signal peptide peptidase SppA [Evansella sp. AB-P1]